MNRHSEKEGNSSIFSGLLGSKGVLMLYPGRVHAHGLLGSVFVFRSISQQLQGLG